MRKNTTKTAVALFSLAVFAVAMDFVFIKSSKVTENPIDFSFGSTALRLPIPVKLKHLNPQRVIDSVEKGLLSTIYSRLIKVDANFKIQPDALESWSYDSSKKKYFFKLRNNVHFHSGKTLTAQDVIYSIHQWARHDSLDSNLLLIIKGVADYQAGSSKTIVGISNKSDDIIEIELTKWSDRFILDLASPRFCLYPKNFGNVAEDEYFLKPDGTGPYKIDERVSEITTLTRSENFYFGTPHISTIKIFYLSDQEAVQNYNNENIDNLIFYQIDGDINLRKFRDSVDNVIRSYKTMILVINDSSDPELSNLKIRTKITKRLSPERLVEACFKGSIVATNLIPKGLAGSQSSPSKQELAETGNETQQGKTIFQNEKTIYIEKTSLSPCIQKELNTQLANSGIAVKEGPFEELYKKLKANRLAMWV